MREIWEMMAMKLGSVRRSATVLTTTLPAGMPAVSVWTKKMLVIMVIMVTTVTMVTMVTMVVIGMTGMTGKTGSEQELEC